MALLLLIGLARTQDLRAWQGVQEGMLTEAADGDLQRAISWYEGLIEGMAPGDPSAGELYYWLGRARYIQGEVDGARKALKASIADDPEGAEQARSLLAQIDALELQIRELPVSHRFDTGTSHWLHSWQHQGRGAIGIAEPEPGDDPALAWTTSVARYEDDRIQVGFAEDVHPASFKLSLRSRSFPAYVLLGAEDERGYYYRLASSVEVGTEGWVELEARVEDFQPVASSAGAGDPWPRRVRTLFVFDVTGRYSEDRGPNTIYIDDVEIR